VAEALNAKLSSGNRGKLGSAADPGTSRFLFGAGGRDWQERSPGRTGEASGGGRSLMALAHALPDPAWGDNPDDTGESREHGADASVLIEKFLLSSSQLRGLSAMDKAAVAIELSPAERGELESLARAQKTGQAMARRARIVLAAAAGLENKAICGDVGGDANTVGKWRRRFAAHRLDGLLDEPRPGTPRRIGDDAIADTIRLTLETTPPGATHWSLRSMAKAVGYPLLFTAWQGFDGGCRVIPTALIPDRCPGAFRD